MNIEVLNQQMREQYHAAGHTGKNIIFAVMEPRGITQVRQNRGRITWRNGAEDAHSDQGDHGTAVTSVLLQWCPDAEIWAYEHNVDGWIAKAFADVTAEAAKRPDKRFVVNMSLSGESDGYRDALNACVAAGVPVVVGAGNDGREVLDRYPSCMETPITVAALHADGTRANFSSWHGEVDFADHGVKVQVVNSDSDEERKNGTSFATPNLAGKVGLMLSACPAMTESEVYARLMALADDLSAEGRDPYTGYGFVRLPAPDAVATNDKKEEEIMANNRTLKLVPKPRMQGDDVRELQRLLNWHGAHIEVDGIFGPATDAAVREFQAAHGLNNSYIGTVGEKTWAALYAEPGAVPDEQENDRTALAADATEWLRMMIGDHYIIGGQGHRLTREYLDARRKAYPDYFTGARYEWLRAEIDRAESMGREIRCEDCSGLFFVVNGMMGVIPESDMTANGLWKGYCTEISFDDVRPLDILFRASGGKMVHMAVVGVDGVYEAAGTAYGVLFRPWAERFDRRTYNRMTGEYDALKAWTHAGRLKL